MVSRLILGTDFDFMLFFSILSPIDHACLLCCPFLVVVIVFAGAVAFNADISKWDISKATNLMSSESTSVPYLFKDGISRFFLMTFFLIFFHLYCVVPVSGGSVSRSCCIQCRSFQVGNVPSESHAK